MQTVEERDTMLPSNDEQQRINQIKIDEELKRVNSVMQKLNSGRVDEIINYVKAVCFSRLAEIEKESIPFTFQINFNDLRRHLENEFSKDIPNGVGTQIKGDIKW